MSKTKTEDGHEYTAGAYAYVGDPEDPSTWKLRIEETPGKVTAAQLGRAAAAFSPGGFRGRRVEIPEADVAKTKAKIRSHYHALGVKDEDIPDSVKASEASGPQLLVSLASITLSQAAQLTRIPIAMLGKWIKGGVRFSITRDDIRRLVENFRKRKADTVIDYEHASEFPEVAQGNPIPAAGWLREIDDEPDSRGVLWGQAEFTQRARDLIAAREYKYLSPAINWAARDKETGEQQGATLTSVALVNRPFLEAMPAIHLSEAGWQFHTEEDEGMGATHVKLADGEKGKLLVTCGECGKQTMADMPEGAMFGADGRIVRLSDVKRDEKGRYNFSSLAELPAGAMIAGEVLYAMDAQRELDEAVKAGKITPAQRPHFEKLALGDLAGFREIVKTLPVQVETGERGIGAAIEDPNDPNIPEHLRGRRETFAEIDAKLQRLITDKAKENPKLDRKEVVRLVASEHADLFARHRELVAKGGHR